MDRAPCSESILAAAVRKRKPATLRTNNISSRSSRSPGGRTTPPVLSLVEFMDYLLRARSSISQPHGATCGFWPCSIAAHCHRRSHAADSTGWISTNALAHTSVGPCPLAVRAFSWRRAVTGAIIIVGSNLILYASPIAGAVCIRIALAIHFVTRSVN